MNIKMMKTKQLRVKVPGGIYPILIGENLLEDASLLAQFIHGQQVCVVTNETVASLYLKNIQSALQKYISDVVVVPDGEQYKTIEQWSRILDQLIQNNHHRDTTLIALGGGVIGDMTGFAAACYHRGVAFIQVPTTLLAQVDASIGGKTAVNHPQGKNLIGAFHQPQAVIIDLKTLDSLPEREFNSGLAEIIKHALIKDADFFAYLEKNISRIRQREKAVLAETVKRACAIKRDVVAADEKEQNIRAILNFGHTFGHAIEQNLGFQHWLHGEAVAMGMQIAADLSQRVGWLDSESRTRINYLIAQTGLPSRLPSQIKCDKLLTALYSDKKVLQGKLRFILLRSIGRAEITNQIDERELQSLLMDFCK